MSNTILEQFGLSPLAHLKSNKSLINNGVWNDTIIEGMEMSFKVRSAEYKAFLAEVQPKFAKLNSKGDGNVDIEKAKAVARSGYSNHILVDWVTYIKEEMYAAICAAYPDVKIKTLGKTYLGSIDNDPLPDGYIAVNCIFFSEDGSPLLYTPANAKTALEVQDIMDKVQSMSGDTSMYTVAKSIKSSS